MASWSGEEVADGIELWLKTRRDEVRNNDSRWNAIDELLDEAREHFVEGWMPWQRIGKSE